MYIKKFTVKNIYIILRKKGIFLPKSICIKTNNTQILSYITNELEHFNIDNTYFSCNEFKNFKNVIVHYKGKNLYLFLSSLSKILSYLILDLYENIIIKKLISYDYFYFSPSEQIEIYNLCIDNLNYEYSLDRLKLVQSSLFKYLNENKNLNLNGFINFRLSKYIEYLDSLVDICVNKFVIDREYLEFVNLLKTYVLSSPSNSNTVHLIYKNNESILLDKDKNIIPINNNIFNVHYLSDISFSSNDYALNNLLTLLPKTLYIHLENEKDEFINTLKLIFDKRIHLCRGCDICKLYKKKCKDKF